MIHNSNNIISTGISLHIANKVVIALHGRGSNAHSILSISQYFDTTNLHWVAPQATNDTWYPYSFLEDRQKNEPWLSSSILVLDEITEKLRDQGINDNQMVFLGFSQGACLASEYVAKRARKFGGLVAFSGGLIGPEIDASEYSGNFEGMPVFMGCSDSDFHIPENRVRESALMFKSLGADVDMILYPNMGHTIVDDEIQRAAKILG